MKGRICDMCEKLPACQHVKSLRAGASPSRNMTNDKYRDTYLCKEDRITKNSKYDHIVSDLC